MADKLLMFDFRCGSCSTEYDDLVPSTQLTGDCPNCGEESKRLIGAPTIDPRMGVDTDFGTMGDKWARKMEKRGKEVKKRQLEHGDTI